MKTDNEPSQAWGWKRGQGEMSRSIGGELNDTAPKKSRADRATRAKFKAC